MKTHGWTLVFLPPLLLCVFWFILLTQSHGRGWPPPPPPPPPTHSPHTHHVPCHFHAFPMCLLSSACPFTFLRFFPIANTLLFLSDVPVCYGAFQTFPWGHLFFNFFFLLILGFWNGCGTIQEKKGNKKNRKMEDMRVESFIGVWSETGGNRRIEREWKLAGKASNFFLLFSLYLKIIIEIKALKFKQY